MWLPLALAEFLFLAAFFGVEIPTLAEAIATLFLILGVLHWFLLQPWLGTEKPRTTKLHNIFGYVGFSIISVILLIGLLTGEVSLVNWPR